MCSASSRPVVRGVVFDMDGTCTLACIDFQEMRRRANILEGDILAVIDSLPSERQAQALAAINAVEREALGQMQLMPGLLSLCQWLDARSIPRGIVTRNSQASLDHFHQTHVTGQAAAFLPALCRDFRPYKPSPAALEHICAHWGIAPAECVMVGDSAKDDVVSGNRAGAHTILLDVEGEHGSGCELAGELRPSHIAASLAEVQALLEQRFAVQPPLPK